VLHIFHGDIHLRRNLLAIATNEDSELLLQLRRYPRIARWEVRRSTGREIVPFHRQFATDHGALAVLAQPIAASGRGEWNCLAERLASSPALTCMIWLWAGRIDHPRRGALCQRKVGNKPKDNPRPTCEQFPLRHLAISLHKLCAGQKYYMLIVGRGLFIFVVKNRSLSTSAANTLLIQIIISKSTRPYKRKCKLYFCINNNKPVNIYIPSVINTHLYAISMDDNHI
jgi:hypothetical protein